MTLQEFISSNVSEIPFGALAMDRGMTEEIQRKLIAIGLLDPPDDGKFGPVSMWALQEYAKRANVSQTEEFSKEIAVALVNAENHDLFSIKDTNDLAGKIAKAMQCNGYWLSRHPECFNIIYIEGCSVDGKANDNPPNQFNDVRLLLSIEQDGTPSIVGKWEATTEPGRYWTEQPMDTRGAARIAFGQYKSWVVGTHRAGTTSAHEALVQVADVTVHRDKNKDFIRDNDTKYTGVFGINQHWGYDLPIDNLGKSSAGCLVGRTKTGHRQFMSLVKSDPRHLASKAYRFMTTILPASKLEQ